mmetsp:Transcript_39644/g.38205  ORF Transcript_39644/g.38205 Transcript_39644/m.38205 type:complete len:92 (-) Transcript_39644:513-788(-)
MWQNRVLMFFEDERELEGDSSKDIFSGLIKETSLFKFEMHLTKELTKRFEFIQWKEKVKKVWLKLSSSPNSQNSQEELKESRQQIPLKNIQ